MHDIYDKFKFNFNLLAEIHFTDANDFDINVIKIEREKKGP